MHVNTIQCTTVVVIMRKNGSTYVYVPVKLVHKLSLGYSGVVKK
jgi:hypothetical protein